MNYRVQAGYFESSAGVLNPLRPGTACTLPYRLDGRRVTNEDNLFGPDDKLLEIPFYYNKQDHILLSTFR